MSAMVKIKRAEPGDSVKLLPLVAAYWEYESISGFDQSRVGPPLERLLATPGLGAGWIAYQDKVAIGYLLSVYVFSLEHLGLTAEIDEFFVLPFGRSSGVGSELLGAAESEFVRIGCTNVSLQLSRANDAARRFYRRSGFAERSGYDLLDKMLHAD
ncbi:MAG: GNAT family N-acetyltransferase [Pseudomonadales bacterium]